MDAEGFQLADPATTGEGWPVTDSSMFAALSKLRQVETVTLRVVNKIVKVECDCVWVRSERTGNDRRISFDEL